MQEVKKIHLKPGYYFSPGFYLDYWRKCIDAKFSVETINTNGRLKQYREMFTGAHMAALQTKLTGVQHFVGLPEDEPPDVDVIRFSPSTTSSGKDATNFDRIAIEITRCDMSKGETILGQISNKNKPAWKNMVLVLHTSGGSKPINFKEISEALQREDVIHLSEIIIVGSAARTKYILLQPGTYAINKVYPELTSDLLQQTARNSFFRTPEVMTKLGRGATRQAKPLGFIELLPPDMS